MSGALEKSRNCGTIVVLSLLHEPLLSCGVGPVVGLPVGTEVAVGAACLVADIAVVALRGTACSEVHSPLRQRNAQGVAVSIGL